MAGQSCTGHTHDKDSDSNRGHRSRRAHQPVRRFRPSPGGALQSEPVRSLQNRCCPRQPEAILRERPHLLTSLPLSPLAASHRAPDRVFQARSRSEAQIECRVFLTASQVLLFAIRVPVRQAPERRAYPPGLWHAAFRRMQAGCTPRLASDRAGALQEIRAHAPISSGLEY